MRFGLSATAHEAESSMPVTPTETDAPKSMQQAVETVIGDGTNRVSATGRDSELLSVPRTESGVDARHSLTTAASSATTTSSFAPTARKRVGQKRKAPDTPSSSASGRSGQVKRARKRELSLESYVRFLFKESTENPERWRALVDTLNGKWFGINSAFKGKVAFGESVVKAVTPLLREDWQEADIDTVIEAFGVGEGKHSWSALLAFAACCSARFGWNEHHCLPRGIASMSTRRSKTTGSSGRTFTASLGANEHLRVYVDKPSPNVFTVTSFEESTRSGFPLAFGSEDHLLFE